MKKSLPISTINLQSQIIQSLAEFQTVQDKRYPTKDLLKIDLHCHDLNSDVPDEILGRILKVPETWLETEDLIRMLKENNADAITITNHNNARSCFSLQEKGIDVLVGAEFTCTVPDFNIGIHVLTFGFNQEQEKVLNKIRRNLYQFLEYAFQNDIPTIWAHPLYYYSSSIPPIEFFEKLSVVFDRFEIFNGQRDSWQNMLTKEWIEHLTPKVIVEYALKHKVDVLKYSNNPYQKSMSGGSDSHIGLFAGQTGTYLHIPNLSERLKHNTPSELALEALRAGKMVPYGSHNNSEKLTIALLDYVCQIGLNKKDSGLLRILLHKGTNTDKFLAFIISNAFSELQHHKVTMKFIELFHKSILGKQPNKMKRLFISKGYKPVFDEAIKIASAHHDRKGENIQSYQNAINAIHTNLVELLYGRLDKKLKDLTDTDEFKSIDFNTILQKLEIPSDLRVLLGKNDKKKGKKKQLDIQGFLDGLSFPFLASGLILAAHYTSAKVLYNNRVLLNQFAEKLDKFKHPKRMLWLTDTYDDKNGVSMFLQTLHREIKSRNLPIDIIVCSNTIQADDHLIVVKPLLEFTLPMYVNQNFNIPNFLEIHQIFQRNEYDRVMCSTEGAMGLAALYLKHAFTVETNFFIHTDWIMFGRKVLNLERSNLDRFRRMLRAYYRAYDQVFVLNTDQEKWLTGRNMEIAPEKVHLTAHWVDNFFVPSVSKKEELFGLKNNEPVLLFAGRISNEKGVFELVDVYRSIKDKFKDIKVVIAGTGPAEAELKEALPDAVFMGWVNHEQLPEIYSSADLLLLPSKFDTFSCVVLEALSCGLPVVSYKTKGPKDIILDNETGFLVNNLKEMIDRVTFFFSDENHRAEFKEKALLRAKDYTSDRILHKLMNDVHFPD